MKKILFAAAAIAAALFASCDKTDDTLDPAMPETSDTARIAITLTGADEADTRAFFDASAKAESWESSLSSLSVFAFDNGGALIIRRDFTSSELSSKSATFSLPKSAAGTECSKAASQSSVVTGTPMPGAMNFSHTQTPASASGKMNSLFYIFENGTLTAGSRVLLEINATYDQDGNGSTTDDRSEVTYSVELTGKAAGEILRNGYYRIAANITGLVGQDCAVTVTVADWETPVTQSVELGA